MEAVSQEAQIPGDYYQELSRLFNLYRTADLNARYYGARVAKFDRWNRLCLGLSAFLSAVALALLVGVDEPWVRNAGAALSGVAAVITGVAPYFGWSEKAGELRSLSFAYRQLFGQIESTITEIKRAGKILPEHSGVVRMIQEGFRWVEARDEPKPDQELIEQEDKKVRAAFPEEYLWTHL